jgi:hypothetical protein
MLPETFTSLTAAAQQATFVAALSASSTLAFEAAMRGYAGSSIDKLLRWATGVDEPRKAPPVVRDQVDVALARTHQSLREADELVHRQYLSRGYRCQGSEAADDPPSRNRPSHVILAHRENRAVGTITLGLDSPAGLLVEEANRQPIVGARAEGKRLGEVVRLAVDDATSLSSKAVLATLFNAAHGLMVLHRLDDTYIEVNPRHVPFYQRALCFKVAGEPSVCPRVGAPSVLLRLPVNELSQKISQIEGALASFPTT